MILYRPDGLPLETSLTYKPRHCFLMTRLGTSVPDEAVKMRRSIQRICQRHGYKLIDASVEVTGHDFLLKIWKLIASTPVSIGICHNEFPLETIMNIYYELGMARTMGKETIIVKSPSSKHPSDLARDEYIEFDKNFDANCSKFFTHLEGQAEYYEILAKELENNPLLAIDYLKRAYLITGDKKFQREAQILLKDAKLEGRAKNSVELLAARF